MDNILYSRHVGKRWPTIQIVLTEERNCFLLWKRTHHDEENTDEEIITHFASFLKAEAIERAVAEVAILEGKPSYRDRDVLTEVACILDGREWDSDCTSEIANLLIAHGFKIGEPGEEQCEAL